MAAACSSQETALTVALANRTQIGICGLPFNTEKVCGFLEINQFAGPQLCCASASHVGADSDARYAICEYTPNQRIGQFIDVLASMFSGVAVLSLLLYAGHRQLRRRGYRLNFKLGRLLGASGSQTIPVSDSSDVIDSSLFLNLMAADLIQAIGNMPTLKWVSEGFIGDKDPVCTAQGAIKQVGIVLTAVTSLAISIQTFYVLVLRWPIRKAHSRWIIVGLWLFIALDVGIPNAVYRKAEVPYYGSTGYWCWIDPFYKMEQIVTEYLWMWVAAISMVILYGFMAVVLLGYGQRRPSPPEPTDSEKVEVDLPGDKEADGESKALAKMMLAYPAVYVFSVLPISVTRWLQFASKKPVPYQATLFGAAIFALSGFFNVVLFWYTRPELVKGGSSTVDLTLAPERQPFTGPLPNIANKQSSPKTVALASAIQVGVAPTLGNWGAQSVNGDIQMRRKSDAVVDDDDYSDYGRLPDALSRE